MRSNIVGLPIDRSPGASPRSLSGDFRFPTRADSWSSPAHDRVWKRTSNRNATVFPGKPGILLSGHCDKCDIDARKALAVSESPRHSLLTRAWHWLNLVAIFILFFSGLN